MSRPTSGEFGCNLQDITERVVVPELAFTGDTTVEFITDPSNAEALMARLLIMECTFLDDEMSPAMAKVQKEACCLCTLCVLSADV